MASTTLPLRTVASRVVRRSVTRDVSRHQYALGVAIALHLLPGALLTAFVLAAAGIGIDPFVALFVGIGLVIVPVELGYLLLRAKLTTGTWSLASILPYHEKLPIRQYALWGAGLYIWFVVLLVISVGVLDGWIANRLFSWYPDSLLQFAVLEGEDDGGSALVLVALAAVVLLFNGLAGPVVEELYFRGHLLPAIDRYGKWAPLLNAALFSVYHFWTPWQNPGRIVGLLPWVYTVWRKRSVHLSIIIHVAVNLTFVLLLIAALFGG